MMVLPFKHKHRATGYAGGTAYGEPVYYGTDGMGTAHYRLVVRCDTCGKRFTVGAFHVPKDKPITADPARKA